MKKIMLNIRGFLTSFGMTTDLSDDWLSFRARSARNLLLTVLFLILGATTNAQAFFGGVAFGGTTSQIDGDHNNGFHKVGFTAGAFVGLELSDILETQFEIKYIQKGARSAADEPYQFLIRLDYVELPLVASANLGFVNINGRTLDWIAVEAGASVDVLAYTNQRHNVANESSNRWKRMCVNGILGLKINVVDKKFQIGTRVITSVNSAYIGNLSEEYTIRFGQKGAFNDVLEFVAYYRF